MGSEMCIRDRILEVEGQLDRVYPGLLPGMSGEATFSVVDARAR